MVIARVRRTLVERELIPAGARVLCACSGGPDSAAMLYALWRLAAELDFAVEAASVDHGLRVEAARDVEIAAGQAAQLGVAFHALRVQVPAGASVQARAREARYAALAQRAAAIGAQRIAVGHTQDDQAETVLSRLLRGAAVRGIAAIAPLRADGVVRPLIDCPRLEVHAFARARFGLVADDRSNSDPRFERVRIRTHVIPRLCAEDRALARHLAELADDAREAIRALDALAETALEAARIDPETLQISALAALPAALRAAVLRRWLEPQTGRALGRAQLRALDLAVRRSRGEVWLSVPHAVRAERSGVLRLCRRLAAATR